MSASGTQFSWYRVGLHSRGTSSSYCLRGQQSLGLSSLLNAKWNRCQAPLSGKVILVAWKSLSQADPSKRSSYWKEANGLTRRWNPLESKHRRSNRALGTWSCRTAVDSSGPGISRLQFVDLSTATLRHCPLFAKPLDILSSKFWEKEFNWALSTLVTRSHHGPMSSYWLMQSSHWPSLCRDQP